MTTRLLAARLCGFRQPIDRSVQDNSAVTASESALVGLIPSFTSTRSKTCHPGHGLPAVAGHVSHSRPQSLPDPLRPPLGNDVRAPLVQLSRTLRNLVRSRHGSPIPESCVGMGDEAHDGAGGKGMSRITITVGEAAEMLGISRTSAYLCARRQEIPTVRLGRRVLVPVARFMAMLEADPAPYESDDAREGES